MKFKDRTEAGKLLAKKLKQYKDKDVVVYALPRGGVVTAVEVANYFDAPLDLVITRKIGHPFNPEYAIGAIAENGQLVGIKEELKSNDEVWLKEEIKLQVNEVRRRREVYLAGRESLEPKDRIAILIDDGIATGLTMLAAIKELRHRKPKKIIAAIPIVPETAYWLLKLEADDVIALDIPTDNEFLGSVGNYYTQFPQVADKEVIALLKRDVLPVKLLERSEKGPVWH